MKKYITSLSPSLPLSAAYLSRPFRTFIYQHTGHLAPKWSRHTLSFHFSCVFFVLRAHYQLINYHTPVTDRRILIRNKIGFRPRRIKVVTRIEPGPVSEYHYSAGALPAMDMPPCCTTTTTPQTDFFSSSAAAVFLGLNSTGSNINNNKNKK